MACYSNEDVIIMICFKFLHDKGHRNMPLNPYYTPHIEIFCYYVKLFYLPRTYMGLGIDDSYKVQREHHINNG